MRLLIFTLLFVVSCGSTKTKISKNVKKAEIYYNHGTQNLMEKNYTDALKHLLSAFELKPDDTRIRNNLGMAYYFKGKSKIAISHIKKAVELDPKNTQARLNLATVYMNTNNYIAAKKGYDQVLEDLTFNQQFRTYHNLGLLSLKQNRPKQALNFFKQAISENDSYCPAHFEMGKLFYSDGNFEKALNSFKSAGKGVCYNNPEPIYHQALAYMKLNQLASARDRLEDIIGRFAGTKIAKSARRKLTLLNTKLDQYEAKILRGEDPYRQVLSPDF